MGLFSRKPKQEQQPASEFVLPHYDGTPLEKPRAEVVINAPTAAELVGDAAMKGDVEAPVSVSEGVSSDQNQTAVVEQATVNPSEQADSNQ